jgi:pectinesterase
VGTPERPQLDASTAARFTVLSYLAQSGDLLTGLTRDEWDPTAGVGDISTFTPDYRVARSGGTHSSVQAAIDDAVAGGGSARRYISVAAGSYREVVCVPTGAPPITLYGLDSDASQTVIVFDNYAGEAKAAGASANPCSPNTNSTTFGTAGSATFAIYASDFQAKNLSFVNDTDEASVDSGAQAVALSTQGDRVLLENVRVLGNQDSLFAKTPDIDSVTRAYLKGCFVEGDTDFVCGRGTLVLDGCTLHSLSRKNGGTILAPSTDHRNPYGILISSSTFSADANAAAGSVHLGRAWDESQGDLKKYAANVSAGTFPNGQAVVRDSSLGEHIDVAAPWQAAATTSRPFSASAGSDPDNSPGNRLYEYSDTAPAGN